MNSPNCSSCSHSFADIHKAARHTWHAILVALGIPIEALTSVHKPCPGCGGRDRFRYDDRDGAGTWYCSGGGNAEFGDGFELLCHVHGWSPAEALKAVSRYLGIDGSTNHATPARVIQQKPAQTTKRDTSSYAKELWLRADNSDEAVAGHPYTKSKGITWAAGAGRVIASGKVIGRDADCVIVPIRELVTNKVVAVQCINSEGAKQTFGSIRCHGLLLGNDLDPHLPILTFEGWASAAAWVFLIERGNACAAAAFGKSNMPRVAELLAEIYPGRHIVVMAEDDQK